MLLTISKVTRDDKADIGYLLMPPPNILINILSAVLPPARVEENYLLLLPGLTTFSLPPILPSISSPIKLATHNRITNYLTLVNL